MKAVFIRPIALLISLLSWLPLQAQSTMPKPNWDRALALQSAHMADTQAVLKSLYQLARAGENQDLLDSLSAIELSPDMPNPARDYLVFSFTIGLGDIDTNAVNQDVLDFLSTYNVRTLVPHDEHPGMGVPLFNIRAAAAGVRNNWDRQQASARAEGLLQEPAELWISSYLAANLAGRRGFVDALDFASVEQLLELGWLALAQLETRPALTTISARAGLGSGDYELLRESIARGSGPDLPGILEIASQRLSAEENISLLDQSLQSGSDTKAALAIAQLAPVHLDEPEVQEMLFSTLANRNLGAAAALVLGTSTDPEIQARLAAMASKDEGLARQRAALGIKTRQLDKRTVR
jgi:hypothetical protein